VEAIDLLNQSPPEVLLVDLGLPDGDGVDVISHAMELSPEPAIMVITVFGDEQRVMRAIRAGASGYLLKTDTSSDICSCIHELLDGGAPISPVIARYLIRHFHEPVDPAAETADLSGRELDVLRLAAKGYTYQEVADLLGVSVNTVGTHTRSVYRKLAVSSRSEAVFEAAKRGLVNVLGRGD
jgi:DNA-binding NarL/FixJ family response regulator